VRGTKGDSVLKRARRSAGTLFAAGCTAAALCCALPAAALAAEVETDGLSANVRADPWGVSFVESNGRVVLEEHPGTGPGPSGSVGFKAGGTWFHATRVVSQRREGSTYVAEVATTDPTTQMRVELSPDRAGVIRMKASIIGERPGLTALGIGFKARPEERYLGFGERSNAVDQRGNEVENYVGEGPYPVEERAAVAGVVPSWGYQPRDDATYFPVPWLLSTHGYGVLIDNIETSYFRLTSESADGWSAEVTNTPPNQPQGAAAPPPAEISLRVFAGPRPADALRRFTEATGRQPPPGAPWYLGPWFQPAGGLSGRARADALRAADVPISVAQTYTRYLPCGVHEGNRTAERNRTRSLHGAGLAVTTYLNPMICTAYQPRYDEAKNGNGLTKNVAGQPYVYRYPTAPFFLQQGDARYFEVSQFDFTAPVGRKVFRDVLSDAFEDGYDGWMEDYGEYTPPDSRSADGTDGTRMHNLYPVQYHCTARDFEADNDRPLARYARSGFTGVAPCTPVVWGGDPSTTWDFDGLRSAVTNGLTMGLSGISTWGSDIGGLFANGMNRVTPELKIRWIQLGAVSGVMRDQAGQFAVPDTEEKVRPQIWDEEILPHWRRYAKLRTQLYPYLAAADAEYQRSGMPIMRHLALVYPGDAAATAKHDEFLFGPDLLAAPVVAEGATTREVYLPAGDWIDVWRSLSYHAPSGGFALGRAATLAGGRTTTIPAPLEQLPLLARAGTILPLLPADVDTLADYGTVEGLVKLADRRDRMELLAFPRGESAASFNRDERLVSSEDQAGWRLTVEGARERTYALQASLATLGGDFEPCGVTLDGRALDAEDWLYDPERRTLVASFRTMSGTLVVERCRAREDPPPASGGPCPIPGRCGTTPATAGGTASAFAGCRDTTRPWVGLARRPRLRHGGSAVVRGRASDRGCGRRARVQAVHVAVRRASRGPRCRFLGRRGRMGPRRSCRRPTLLRVRGTSKWWLRLPARLPRGRYRVYVIAVDRAGNRRRGRSMILRVA
jgi:sulfoquinovosidase